MSGSYSSYNNGVLMGQGFAAIDARRANQDAAQANANAMAWRQRCEELERKLESRTMELKVAVAQSTVHFERLHQLRTAMEQKGNVLPSAEQLRASCRQEIDCRIADEGLYVDRAAGVIRRR